MRKLLDTLFNKQPVERAHDPLAQDVHVARERLKTAQQEMADHVHKLLEQNESLRGRHHAQAVGTGKKGV